MKSEKFSRPGKGKQEIEEEVELLDPGLEQLGEKEVTELMQQDQQGKGREELQRLERQPDPEVNESVFSMHW